MILKELAPPQRLLKTQALKRRLIPGHVKHPEIENSLARRKAGYWGERILSQYLKQLPHDKYHIIHDLHLELNGFRLQIDHLLLSQNFILLIESKNIQGTLFFDDKFNQLIRHNDDGTEEVFEDPRVQARWHRVLLEKWLNQKGFHMLPIDFLIFFASNKTILKTHSSTIRDAQKICKARDIFNKIYSLERQYNGKKIRYESLIDIGKLLLNQHVPEIIDILKEYGIVEKDILLGVRCPYCSYIPMWYEKGKWRCPSCHTLTFSHETFREAIHDYCCLYKPTITNSKFRHFLFVPI
ncbi:NERD domain-containing protein [Neobacillus mesonae]|nr:NERD domain-containing protein [Neobacillus mesonae]